jgi:hypothetical protein
MAASSGLAMDIASLADPLAATLRLTQAQSLLACSRRPKPALIYSVLPFFCSTAPQAFFRPNRESSRPARADAVKAGRSSAATEVLGLYSIEHDGMLMESGRSIFVAYLSSCMKSRDATSQFRFRLSLQHAGSGSGKSPKKRARNTIKKRDPA